MISLNDLLRPIPEQEALDWVLEILSSFGFETTAWQPGGMADGIVRTGARVLSSASLSVSKVASGGYLGLASGPWLQLLGESLFQISPAPAVATQGVLRLTASLAAPVSTWNAGELLFANAAQDPAVVYRNLAAGSIGPGGTLDIPVECIRPGQDGNIPSLVTIYQWTPLVGVVATNPIIGFTGTWITRPGRNKESDDSYTQKLKERWSTLSYGNADGAYDYWARNAIPGLVTRCSVKEAWNGPGSIKVTVASALGGVDPSDLQDIRDYIYGIPDGVGRRPINDIVTVVSANVVNVAVQGTVYVQGRFSSGVLQRIGQRLDSYLGSLPIGGQVIPGMSGGRVLFAELIDQIMNEPGCINVVLSNPTQDLVLGTSDVCTGIYNLMLVAV